MELARTFLFLADRGIAPHLETPVIAPIQSRQVNALMMTSGMYQNAGEFAWRVGLPAKSGVGGGIVAIVPQEMAIADGANRKPVCPPAAFHFSLPFSPRRERTAVLL